MNESSASTELSSLIDDFDLAAGHYIGNASNLDEDPTYDIQFMKESWMTMVNINSKIMGILNA